MAYKKICVVEESETEQIPRNRLVEVKNGTPFIDYPYVDNIDELSGKAIYLDECYDWVLGRSEIGSLVCIPLKKEKN